MIVVVGSRHDRVAAALVDRWSHAGLCSAEDLTSGGWVWPVNGTPAERLWVVEGRTVPDEVVSGVFLRRSTVFPEELLAVHPDDRTYVAAETHAFLVFVLATTGGVVANPVVDGALGEETLRPDRWMPAARAAGLAVAPLRLTSGRTRPRSLRTSAVEVVGGAVVGDLSTTRRDRVEALAASLDLHWGAVVFDGRHRVVTVTATATPSGPATGALEGLLQGRAA